MQVGINLAIKTLANRFEPLNEVYRNFTEEAFLAEDLGFDFVTTSEHHLQDDAWSPSQLPILAYIAARTSRMRIGTNVFLLPLHDPLRVSEDLATVDILSDGRVDFVVGSGSIADEFDTWGIDPKTRWGRLFEGLDLIRRSFTEDRFDYEGKYFQYPNVHQTTKPVQDPFPLWVGGFGPKIQKRAGLNGYHAQGWAKFNVHYLEGLAEGGHDPADVNLAAFFAGHMAATKKQAWEECKEGWWNWQNEYRKRQWLAHPDADPMPPIEEMDGPPDTFMAPLLGTPDDILNRLVPDFTGGDCTHFSFNFRASGGGLPTEVVRANIRLFAKEIMPILKDLGREPKTSRAVD